MRSVSEVYDRKEEYIELLLLGDEQEEMIYKYLVLIMLKYNEPEAAEVYINKLQAVSDGSAGIIKDIATESLGICKAAKEGCAMRETGAYTYMYI